MPAPLRPATDDKPLVLFHAQCLDGLVAAWLAWHGMRQRADFVPVRYGEAPPPCADRTVMILDFCYTPELTARMADEAKRIVILDHHKTSIAAFQSRWVPRANVLTLFDTTLSGAELAASYFDMHGEWMVAYVADRDLWRFALSQSRGVNAFLAAAVLGRETRDAFLRLDEIKRMPMRKVVAQGEGAQLQVEAYIRQVKAEARLVSFAGYPNIPLLNLAKPMTSDVVNELAEGRTFAVGWREEAKSYVFSLRSRGAHGFDVAQLAERFGGGGHHNAAGFTLLFERPEQWATVLGIEEARGAG
jgi:uncharacterized protein